jgi:hypothetical protein
MHRTAHEISLQVGNTSIAALHKQFLIVRQLHAGYNLESLKETIKDELKMAELTDNFPMLRSKLQIYKDAILDLIGDESVQHHFEESDASIYDKDLAYIVSRMMSLTYLGFYERARFLFSRWQLTSGENESKMISFRSVYVCFYFGLTLFGLQRQRKKGKSTQIKESPELWLDTVEHAAELSEWNFRNKVSLLLAEKYSLSKSNTKAEEMYSLAIAGAQSSKFIQEEALGAKTLLHMYLQSYLSLLP